MEPPGTRSEHVCCGPARAALRADAAAVVVGSCVQPVSAVAVANCPSELL